MPPGAQGSMRKRVPFAAGAASSSGLAQLAPFPRILGSALRRLQERQDGALVHLGRWDRVTALGVREQAGAEQLLRASGLGGSGTPFSCCARAAHLALACVCV